MQTVATILAYASGFALMGYRESPAGLIATSLAVDASLAPLTAIIAARRGRATMRWALGGFIFGLWAFILVLLVGSANDSSAEPPAGYPPTSDAA